LEDLKAIPFEHIHDKEVQEAHDHMYKLIIIGSTGVGKSCLMRKVMNDDFKNEHQVTIGVEFGSYGIRVDDKVIKMQIWDTAGQESYKSVTRVFYRGAHFVFLTYDITREETFNDMTDWCNEVKNHASEDVRIYLVGNKCELEDQREVSFDRALEFAKANGIHKCFETSAKTGDVVEVLFSCASKELYQNTMRDAEANVLKTQAVTGTVSINPAVQAKTAQ